MSSAALQWVLQDTNHLYRVLADVDGTLVSFDGYWLALMDLSWL
jgi:hypothetical protein